MREAFEVETEALEKIVEEYKAKLEEITEKEKDIKNFKKRLLGKKALVFCFNLIYSIYKANRLSFSLIEIFKYFPIGLSNFRYKK